MLSCCSCGFVPWSPMGINFLFCLTSPQGIQLEDRLEDPELLQEWRPPRQGYCYKKETIGLHAQGTICCIHQTRLSSFLKRGKEVRMCLHEALCWKQLPDWLTTDPPAWTCTQNSSRRIYDLSFRNAVMADQSTFVEKSPNELSPPGTRHEVFLCSCKSAASAIANYHYPFKICPGVKGTECTKQKPR